MYHALNSVSHFLQINPSNRSRGQGHFSMRTSSVFFLGKTFRPRFLMSVKLLAKFKFFLTIFDFENKEFSTKNLQNDFSSSNFIIKFP